MKKIIIDLGIAVLIVLGIIIFLILMLMIYSSISFRFSEDSLKKNINDNKTSYLDLVTRLEQYDLDSVCDNNNALVFSQQKVSYRDDKSINSRKEEFSRSSIADLKYSKINYGSKTEWWQSLLSEFNINDKELQNYIDDLNKQNIWCVKYSNNSKQTVNLIVKDDSDWHFGGYDIIIYHKDKSVDVAKPYLDKYKDNIKKIDEDWYYCRGCYE